MNNYKTSLLITLLLHPILSGCSYYSAMRRWEARGSPDLLPKAERDRWYEKQRNKMIERAYRGQLEERRR